MATQCTSNAFPLAGLGRRHVVAKFDGGRLCSDGGAVLLRAANQAFQVTGRLAACFIDHRNPARVEHSLESLLGQRVFALALGYEDINDHDRLRDDSLLALALDGPGRAAGGSAIGAMRWLARARSTGWSWVRRWRQTRIATRRSWRARNRSTTCWWICSWTCPRRSRSGSCWTWMPPTISCTASRRVASITAITATIATCRCTSRAESMCCVRACGRRRRRHRRGRSRNWSGSCGASGSAGRRQRSWCAGTPVFVGTRS